jgi:two-component system sensor kinase FixL
MADRIQLQQVVFNLVRNAIEAMADRAGAELTIATRLTSAGIELRVADRGPGLPAEVAERLFEPFVTTKESGMGIGLPICRSIVRAHGGDIHAEPGPDGGTVFVVTLPPADAA